MHYWDEDNENVLWMCVYHREFDLAEMEYFVNPEKKKERFAKFQSVADVTPYLWDRDKQLTGAGPIKMSLGEAVSSVSTQ